jgi:hypothetical protein
VIRLCLIYALVFTVILLTMNLIVRVLGSTQLPNAALTGLRTGCEILPQPCWYGIVPGVTTAEEQDRLMQQHNFIPVGDGGLIASYENMGESSHHCQRVVVMRTQDTTGRIIVHEIILTQCPAMQSGHLMSLFTVPTMLSITTPIFIYEQGVISAEFTPSDGWYQSPFEPVENIRLRARNNGLMHGWHGFALPWRYCQLEADIPGCG